MGYTLTEGIMAINARVENGTIADSGSGARSGAAGAVA